MTNLFFFHCSDDYIETFDPQFTRLGRGGLYPPDRPVFYWFSDVQYSHHYTHQPTTSFEKYVYLFVINPKKQGIGVRNRADHREQFDGLWRQFQYYQSDKQNCEPPVLMSFCNLTPSLTLEHLGNGVCRVIFPVKSEEFRIVDEQNQKIPFDRIEVITRLLPEIKTSLPFVEPLEKNGHFIYDDWLEMVSEKNGSWL